MGSAGLVRRGAWAIDTFTRLGAPPPATSRLPRAVSLIRRINDNPSTLDPADDALLQRISNAQQTIWSLFVVAYAADQRTRTSQQWFPRELLSQALGGADDPEHDGNTKARNTEFELYVGSVLAISGATVRFVEPDLEVFAAGRRAGIAVKRMSSLSDEKLVARLREAAVQIERTHGFGYVAVNIDAYYRGERLLAGDAESALQFDERLKRVAAAVGRALEKRQCVKGVLAFGYMDAWDTSAVPPRHSAAFPTSFQLITDDGDVPEDVSRLTEFWSRVQRTSQAEFRYLVTGGRA